MRNLPFSDPDIAEAAGHTAALFAWGFHLPGSGAAAVMADDYFGESQELEFSATDGSSSRGYASKQDLLAAVRADIGDILTEASASLATDITALLVAICSPARLFEFDAFARVFARQVIPCQALRRDRVLFSPARLESFGIV
jgi:hypothetical protein